MLPTTRPPSEPRSRPDNRWARLVTADEVAHAIAYLASPLSASTTGTVLAVDGGMLGLRLPSRPPTATDLHGDDQSS